MNNTTSFDEEKELDKLAENIAFLIEGVLIPILSALGIIGKLEPIR